MKGDPGPAIELGLQWPELTVQPLFHVTHLSSGKLVEGIAAMRTEEQVWTLARGVSDWLIAHIDVLATGAADRGCALFREAS